MLFIFLPSQNWCVSFKGNIVSNPAVEGYLWMYNCAFCYFHSELPSASAWPQPAWHHHQICWHGKERDQQTSETEGKEERVKENAQEKT